MPVRIKEPVISREEDVFNQNRASPSSINKWLECPFKWACIYILKLIFPMALWITAGNAGHKAQEGNNAWKMQEGRYMNRKILDDYVRTCFEEQLSLAYEENGDIVYMDGETEESKRREEKEYSDYLRAGLKDYLSEAKRLEPVRIEEPWRIDFKNTNFYIAGITDHECIDVAKKETNTVIDYKFKKSRFGRDVIARLKSQAGPPDI